MTLIFRNLYLFYVSLSLGHAVALLLLSLTTSLLILLLSRLFARYPAREAQVQALMAPQLAEISRDPDPHRRHARTAELYRRYRYHPILALRSALPLFLQLPFLFAVYHALRSLPELSGVSLGIIRDLSQPDALLVGYNVLPFVMTAINLLTAGLNPLFTMRDRIQAIVIAAIFLILLYSAPAALLIYWTLNNLFFLMRILHIRRSEPSLDTTPTSLRHYLPSLYRELLAPFFVLIILSNLLQFLADAQGRFFGRFSKTLPLMAAAMGFYLVQLQLYRRRRPRGYLAAALPLVAVGVLQASGRFSIAADNYAIFPLLAAYYLLLGSALRLINIFKIKRNARVRPERRFGTWSHEHLALLLVLMVPVLHLASVNHAYLFGGYYLLFLLLPFGIYLLARAALFAFAPASPDRGRNPLFAAAFSFVYIFMPTLRAAMQKSSAHDADFWLLLLAIMLGILALRGRSRVPMQERHSPASLRKKQRGIAAISAVFLFIFLVRFGLSFMDQRSASGREIMPIPPELQELSISDSANVYLFVYDGIPNERVFRDQQLPFEPLKALLDAHNFRVYDDSYTLGDESLNSMAMMLNITDQRYSSQIRMQDIYSGNNLVNSVLRESGYRAHLLLENYYTGSAAIANQDIVAEFFPPKELSDVHSDFFITLLRGVLQGEFRFDTKGILSEERYTEADRQARKHELIREPATRRFVLDHFSLPGHSQNSGQCLPNETELWIERYMLSLKQMESDLKELREHDPEAIVILIGDHGPALTGDCYVLQNWALEDITADLIWDRIGTLVAIHWPEPTRAARYDHDLQVNQDVFAIVLAYLADDPAPLELLPDRTFSGYELLTRRALRFRLGEILD